MRDPIVEEIWRLREEHGARFNYDLNAIYNDLKRRERESGRAVVCLEPKHIPKVGHTGMSGRVVPDSQHR